MTDGLATFNVYDHVTQTIIDHIEAGTAPWVKSWTGSSGRLHIPQRVSGEEYRGINVLMLWIEAARKGYVSPRWMTYRQAQELGGQVRKGEKSATVVKYGTLEKDAVDATTGNCETRFLGYAKAYRVFCADQIDGLPAEFYAKPDPARDLGSRAVPELDAWFGSMGVTITSSSKPEAYYSPSEDLIHMPPIETFVSAAKFYGTLSHETAHAVGASHRLNRQHPGTAQQQYAREEVVAELCAAMVSARLGIEVEYDQNAAYLHHWVSVLKEDNRAILRAASMAQAAADWMFTRAGAVQNAHCLAA